MSGSLIANIRIVYLYYLRHHSAEYLETRMKLCLWKASWLHAQLGVGLNVSV